MDSPFRDTAADAGDFDLVIRGGLIVDGSGNAPYLGDVGIEGSLIAAVGVELGRGRREIDATGLIVTPGFVDIHSHYDGQASWTNIMAPSSSHGVTTVVMGNCGIGFAPCRPEDRASLISLMEGVEDIPEVVMAEGLAWTWETFPEYLDAIEALPHDVDIAAQLPHSALRVYVMGDRGLDRQRADGDDLAEMARLGREAIRAGALGIATSRTLIHRSAGGDFIPSYNAAETELHALAGALAAEGQGVVQAVIDIAGDTLADDLGMLQRVAQSSGRPLSFSLAQPLGQPDLWKDALKALCSANEQGIPIRAQVYGRPIGMLLGLDLSFNPFSNRLAYREIAHLPLAERVAEMRRPDRRTAILEQGAESAGLPFLAHLSRFDWMFELGDPPNYAPDRQDSIEAMARQRGIPPEHVAYDLLLKDEGKAIMLLPRANYADGDLNAVRQMMEHPNTVLGLADGGAHCGVICDASLPTFMLTYWARDRGEDRMSVAQAVRALTAEPAEAVGLLDRGRIAAGFKADINIIDHNILTLHSPYMVADLPAGGRRLHQRATGYVATIVSGVQSRRDDQATGALPGRLVRGARSAPVVG